MERLPNNKMNTRLRNLSPWRRGWEGRKNKDNLEWKKRTPLGKNWGVILRMLKTEGWSYECWKELAWQSRLSWRISIHIEVWEHHLEKVWNQHLTSKQLEYHNSKQNKGLACKISQNKHMIEISSKVFVVEPHGLDRTAPSCTRQCTWHTKRPRVGIAKDSLRHNEATVKPTVNRRTTRRRTPISYHTSVGKIS